uniref:Uncharacterized protein n=1 Tax=Hyaloperonospora arabidopsidis (strain Emoy2) TaxID=559515 RepID=M4BHA7_HYAAE
MSTRDSYTGKRGNHQFGSKRTSQERQGGDEGRGKGKQTNGRLLQRSTTEETKAVGVGVLPLAVHCHEVPRVGRCCRKRVRCRQAARLRRSRMTRRELIHRHFLPRRKVDL